MSHFDYIMSTSPVILPVIAIITSLNDVEVIDIASDCHEKCVFKETVVDSQKATANTRAHTGWQLIITHLYNRYYIRLLMSDVSKFQSQYSKMEELEFSCCFILIHVFLIYDNCLFNVC